MNNLLDVVYDQQLQQARETILRANIFGALFILYNDKLTTLEKIEQVTKQLEKAVEIEGGEKK